MGKRETEEEGERERAAHRCPLNQLFLLFFYTQVSYVRRRLVSMETLVIVYSLQAVGGGDIIA